MFHWYLQEIRGWFRDILCEEIEMLKFVDILGEYILGRIDANMLHEQMKMLFSEYINDNLFRKLQYLKIYPFISALQDEDIYQEHLLKKEITQIIEILEGKKAFIYAFWMNLEGREMSQISRIWDRYKKNGTILFEQSELLEKELFNLVSNTETIEDICQEKLLSLLVDLPTVSAQNDNYNLLYTNKKVDEMSISENVEKLIKIMTGKIPVHVMLKYGCNECTYMIL